MNHKFHTVQLIPEKGVQRDVYPHSEDWVFGIILGLFIFYVFAIHRSFGWFRESLNGITKVRSRSSIFSNATQAEYNARHLLTFGSSVTISLFVYIELCTFMQPVDFVIWFWIFLSTLGFIMIKEILIRVVGYVFIDPASMKTAKQVYYFAFNILGAITFPLLLLRVYWEGLNHYVLISIAVFFFLTFPFLLILKLLQIFYKNFLDLIYIMLYLCTLEITPMIILFKVYRTIIQG